jgi:hypothetical protein
VIDKLKPSSLAQKWRGETRREDAARKKGKTVEAEPKHKPRVIWNPPCARCPDPYPVHVRGLYAPYMRGKGDEPIKLCSICVIFYDREMEKAAPEDGP